MPKTNIATALRPFLLRLEEAERHYVPHDLNSGFPLQPSITWAEMFALRDGFDELNETIIEFLAVEKEALALRRLLDELQRELTRR